ncbi:MAG: AlpA family phage regulatory protein [Alphaproteobacteria bacterium]
MKILTFDRLGPDKGIPYSRDHLRRLTNSGKFPRPMQLSESRIAWRETDIDEWLNNRPSPPTSPVKTRNEHIS